MWTWLRDHVLPGLILWVVTGAFPLSHWHLWRRVKRLVGEQQGEVKDGSDGKGGN